MGKALAVDLEHVPTAKRSASGFHLTALEAAQMDHLVPLLDFPEIWEWSEQHTEYAQMSNAHFVQDVEKRLAAAGLSKDDPVILICRSGVRSNSASGLLAQYGFRRAYTVIDGFEGDTAKDGERKGQRVVNG